MFNGTDDFPQPPAIDNMDDTGSCDLHVQGPTEEEVGHLLSSVNPFFFNTDGDNADGNSRSPLPKFFNGTNQQNKHTCESSYREANLENKTLLKSSAGELYQYISSSLLH